MSDDIVKRLLQHQHVGDLVCVLCDAADEIKRLRSESREADDVIVDFEAKELAANDEIERLRDGIAEHKREVMNGTDADGQPWTYSAPDHALWALIEDGDDG